MSFSHQLRAARAMANLHRNALAEISGVSERTIQNIESGGDASGKTEEKLVRAFEALGIRFTENGVEYLENNILFLNSFLDVLDDAEHSLPRGGEILIHCADERRNSPAVTARFQELLKAGYKLRFTIEDGNSTITTLPENYRGIDPDYFSNSEVRVIYADKTVSQVKAEKKIFIIIKSAENARVERKQFEYWWKAGRHVKA